MNIKQLSQETLDDGTLRILLEVERYQAMYVVYFLESFEGFCNYTTPDKKESILQVDVAPDYIDDTKEVLEYLENWELD